MRKWRQQNITYIQFISLSVEKTLLENIDVNIENQNYTFNAGKADRFGFAAATFHGSWTGIVFTKCTYYTDYSQGSCES